MADKKDEKKESKGQKRYNHGPKIVDKEPMSKDGGEAHIDRGGGAAPKGSVESGTDGVQSNASKPSGPGTEEGKAVDGVGAAGVMHSAERDEMHGRHMHEHMQMHHRHEREHAAGAEEKSAMHTRHHKEHQEMHTRHEKELKAMMKRHEGAAEEKEAA